MKKPVSHGIILLLICILQGCASIVSKSNHPVSINSNPRGADITITDKHGIEVFRGQTPTALKLKGGDGYFKKNVYQIKITKQGYQDQLIPVRFELNGWYFGNILFGGVIGLLIVDPLTGAMWKIQQDDHFVTLNPKDLGRKEMGVAINIKLLEQASPAEKAAMVRIR